jgi:hypothetical protein
MPRSLEDAEGRIRILEKAVANLGDALKKRDVEFGGDLRDIAKELKALKVYLGRNMPEFRKQYPDICSKVK